MSKSKKSINYITFLNKKYKKQYGINDSTVLFYNIDDYMLFLFYERFHENEEKYYYRIEEDIIEYANIQQGIKKRAKKASGGIID